MVFTKEDAKFMKIALDEAKKSLDNGDIPVGAVLIIDGKLVDKGNNALYSNKSYVHHAEMSLLMKNSSAIKKAVGEDKLNVTLYTTLEPCLMCLGACNFHNISRIVYACPDPHAGATKLDVRPIGMRYKQKWPIVESGLFQKESKEMIDKFFNEHWDKSSTFQSNKELFKEI